MFRAEGFRFKGFKGGLGSGCIPNLTRVSFALKTLKFFLDIVEIINAWSRGPGSWKVCVNHNIIRLQGTVRMITTTSFNPPPPPPPTTTTTTTTTATTATTTTTTTTNNNNNINSTNTNTAHVTKPGFRLSRTTGRSVGLGT